MNAIEHDTATHRPPQLPPPSRVVEVRRPSALPAVFILIAVSIYTLTACDDSGDAPTRTTAQPAPAIDTGPPWHEVGKSHVLAADAPQRSPALAEAIEKARATMDQARIRWSQADADERRRWAVKWAAPLESGAVEYLWVTPEHWSPFRVEGVLLNDPVHALLDGAQRGDSVSFPAEELCDWMRLPKQSDGGPIEGGFTNAALTEIESEDASP